MTRLRFHFLFVRRKGAQDLGLLSVLEAHESLPGSSDNIASIRRVV